MKDKKQLINLLIGPFLLYICCQFLPSSIFGSIAEKASIGTVLWMAYWWVSGPVDYAVTAFLPIGVNAIIKMMDMNVLVSNYSSEIIMLLLGASIITVAWEETGLDRRVSAKFLSLIGCSLRNQIIFWFMLCTILSSILPNTVVCATVTPIAVSMLRYVGEKDVSQSKKASKILLAIAYAAGIGGLASPLGGSMNLVTVKYLEEISNVEYMYIDWFIRFLPIMIVLVISNIIFILRDVKKDEVIGGTKAFFIEEYKKLPKMDKGEKLSFIIFAICTILAFTRQFYQVYLPELKPAYIFIIGALLTFVVTNNNGERIMSWSRTQKKIVWDLIYIIGGGLAAGSLINLSGAAESIGNAVALLNVDGGFITIFFILSLSLIMSDFTSNTATAAIAIPIVISVMTGLNKNPIPYIYVATIGVNLSYMFPTSIRAIPVGYGLSPKYMFKEGWKMTILVVIILTICSYLLILYWPEFSTIS